MNYYDYYEHERLFGGNRASQSSGKFTSLRAYAFIPIVTAIAFITHLGQPSPQKMPQKLPQGTAIGR